MSMYKKSSEVFLLELSKGFSQRCLKIKELCFLIRNDAPKLGIIKKTLKVRAQKKKMRIYYAFNQPIYFEILI